MADSPTKLRTAERILDSAQTLILQDGFHGVTVDTIIAKSGVSKGTFFYHFKSKDALAEALLHRFIVHQGDTFETHLRAIDAQTLPPLDALLALIRGFPRYADVGDSQQGCMLAAFSYQLLNELPALRPICRASLEGWEILLRPYFERVFNRESDLDANRVSRLIQMMFCLMEGAFIVERIDQAEVLSRQFAEFAGYIEILTKSRLPG